MIHLFAPGMRVTFSPSVCSSFPTVSADRSGGFRDGDPLLI
jgi:hypothetical protein